MKITNISTKIYFQQPPLQILWRKKKEGENFEEEEEGMRGGRRKKERKAPPSSGGMCFDSIKQVQSLWSKGKLQQIT